MGNDTAEEGKKRTYHSTTRKIGAYKKMLDPEEKKRMFPNEDPHTEIVLNFVDTIGLGDTFFEYLDEEI